MAFKLNKRGASSIENPEVLFRDLRNRSVQGLLSQQADMLRAYMSHVDDDDVAMQMPTGSGKTLVGLLIAEWRRRTRRERTVYLCPTRQLVNQVVEQASKNYGIRALAFTGSKRNFLPSAKSEYSSAEVLAVTTYSGLFNTNPFFSDAQLIVLDDAHAAENYVGDYWSLSIEKWNTDQIGLFTALLSMLKAVLPATDYTRLNGDSEDDGGSWVNKLPSPTFFEIHEKLLALFDIHCGADSELRFTWRVLRDHLKSCHLYYGRGRFLIKPLISPTESHAPFVDAVQRVYMSATLGEGGELERLVGRRKLTRIPAPVGWDRQGIGRRLFFFPMRSMDDANCLDLVRRMTVEAGRCLILTPSEREAEKYRKLVREELTDFKLFSASDIESSKEDFVKTSKAAAVIANRYDGIDLAGDECRLLIASGLPAATNLQEQFLMSRMAVPILYNDRIRTRIIQAIGRCTRSATDYSAVVVLGEQLNRFLLQHDTRKYLHPELQAEIEFGIDESKDLDSAGSLENLGVLLRHEDDWDQVDAHILSERDSLSQEALPCVENFLQAVSHEVAYQYAFWNEDYPAALDAARKVLTAIVEPEELRGYRAFWMYLAGNAAWLMHQGGIHGMDSTAREYYAKVAKATKGISWIHELARRGLFEPESGGEDDANLDLVIERLEHQFEMLETLHDRKFERRIKEILDGLGQSEAGPFENAQVLLGNLLGYVASNSDGDSAPDPWWVLTSETGIVFEDYTYCKVDAVISTEKVRQAVSHPAWLKSQDEYNTTHFDAVFLSPSRQLGAGAAPVAADCFYWEMSDFVSWGIEAISTVRSLRMTFVRPGDLAWRAEAKEEYLRAGLDPVALHRRACSTRLSALQESNRR